MAVCLHCGLAPTDPDWGGCPFCAAPIRTRGTGVWPILAAVAVIVAVLAVGAFFFLNNKVAGIADAAPTTTTTVTTTTEPQPTSTTTTSAPPGPDTVVQSYYQAINNHDYQTAWDLGGKNLGGSYEQFSAGFADTAKDQITVVGVSGDTVQVQLTAQQTDGTARNFTGSYTVEAGLITKATLKAGR